MCTKECGQLQPPDERELIEAFEIAMNDAFAFLGPEHHLEPEPLSVFTADPDRQPVDRDDAEYPFVAVQEFTGSHHPVRITYGERAYQLNLEVGAIGSGYHSIDAWLNALGLQPGPEEHSGVSTPTSLARHARRLARALRDHFESIREAGPSVLDRLATSVVSPLHQVRDEANLAFAAGDYPTYVRLLAPHVGSLTATEQRKLEFASQKVA